MTRDEQWVLEEKYGNVPNAAFAADKARLAAGEPVAYVIGSQPFLGLTVYLDSRPLIPRPETEWWTEQLLASLLPSNGLRTNAQASAARSSMAISAPKGSCAEICEGEAERGERLGEPTRPVHLCADRPLTFLDLCAGSGAIGCAALARLPDAHVTFAELDSAHKDTIAKNIRENTLDASRSEIVIGDLFAPLAGRRFDVIACNPPYIPTHRVLEKSVADFEPPAALFSGHDGLALMRRVALELPAHLTKKGVAWIECDSAHAADAAALFVAQGLSTEVRTDQYGVPRVLVVSFP